MVVLGLTMFGDISIFEYGGEWKIEVSKISFSGKQLERCS